MSGEAVLEFTTAGQQMTHTEFVGLPVTDIQMEATSVFVGLMWDQEVRQHHHLVGRDRTLNDALN